MAAGDTLPKVEITSRVQWRQWLVANHATSGSIWLVTWKTAHPQRHVPYGDIVEEALCFGWVDSLPRKLDDDRSMLLLAPRKPASAWSRINKERAERLIAAGLMAPAGQKTIDAARASGRWTALDAVESLDVPDDLATALKKKPAALGHFERFPRSAKRAILEWIAQARRPETRARRIKETVDKAAENLRVNQWRP